MSRQVCVFAALSALVLCTTHATAQIESPEVRDVLKVFEEKERLLTADYEELAAGLRKRYLADHDRLRSDAVKKFEAALKKAIKSGNRAESGEILAVISKIKKAAKPKRERRIVFLTNGDDPFWNVCRKGMDDAAKEFKIKDAGLTHSMDKGSEFRTGNQLEKLAMYTNQTDIAAIAISPIDAANPHIARALKRLRDKGVAVICVDSDMDRNKFRDSRFAFLGTNNLTGGEELGKAAKGLTPAGAKYVTFVGLKTVVNARQRIGGFEKFAGKNSRSLDSFSDDGDFDQARENVATAIDKYRDDSLNTLVGIWAYNAHAIVEAVEKRKVRDRQKIVVFDAAATAVTDMERGMIDAMVVQNPYQMGYLSVKLMKALAEDDHESIAEIFSDYDPAAKKFTAEDGDIFDTELRVVVPNEKSPLKPSMFRPATRFYYYKDFKKWLTDRGITSS